MYIRSYLTQSIIDATRFMNCPISFIRMNMKCLGQYRKGCGIRGVWVWVCPSTYPAMWNGRAMYTLEFRAEADVKNGLLLIVHPIIYISHYLLIKPTGWSGDGGVGEGWGKQYGRDGRARFRLSRALGN